MAAGLWCPISSPRNRAGVKELSGPIRIKKQGTYYREENSMDVITLVGFIAGTLTTVAYVPQVVRSWRLKETRDISLSMLVLYAIGVFLWLLYGCWTNALPIIVANGISEILILILLGIKLHYL